LKVDAPSRDHRSIRKRAYGCLLGLVVVGSSILSGPRRIAASTAPVIRVLTAAEQAAMRGVVWKPGCPVALNDLRRVQAQVLGMDGSNYTGALVVHKNLANGVARILTKLYEARYPVESMIPIEAFGGDDDRSTMANNSSAFNCRPVAGSRSLSEHAYGRAIDINPVQNPYVRADGTVLDPAATRFVDRAATANESGVIVADGEIVKIFRSEGWKWGGLFKRTKDYQHFSTSGR
jgi:D-alanyl-D-alanine carboxypeptidase